jgi:hypothetical protein
MAELDNEDLDTDIGDLSRSYGTNWKSVPMRTLFEWVHIAAFNIRCLEYLIERYRAYMRNHMILNLVLSTASGTLSVSTFGSNTEYVGFITKILFTVFSFLIAIGSGTLKIYQIQERLEQAIRIKQDWIVFSTKITSELQLPRALRRDALWMIKQNKEIYLDLMKTETEIPTNVKAIVAKELPHPQYLHLDQLSLSRIMIDVTTSKMITAEEASTQRQKKTVTAKSTTRRLSQITVPVKPANNVNNEVPADILITVPPPAPPTLQVRDGSPPALPPSYSAQSPSQSQLPPDSERPS